MTEWWTTNAKKQINCISKQAAQRYLVEKQAAQRYLVDYLQRRCFFRLPTATFIYSYITQYYYLFTKTVMRAPVYWIGV